MKTTILTIMLGLCLVYSYAQENNTLKTSVDVKKILFQAESFTAQKGMTRQLTPGYTLTINGDTLISSLPYAGRVYQASLNSDGGLNFTSHQFDYTVKARKKGGWDISIKTKDLSSQVRMSLTVFENGRASLSMFPNDRESISYNGYVGERP